MRILSLAPRAADARRARGLARAKAEATLLRDAGHEVVLATTGPSTEESPCFSRDDRWPDHWHKSRHLGVEHALVACVRERDIELVHVHHWEGLSRSLVLAAARAGVPAVVSLHDAWIACLIGSRVRPVDGAPCDVTVGAHPCLACAAAVGPRTPWVPMEQSFLLLAERQRDLQRELELARACWITSPQLVEPLARWFAQPVRATEMFEPDVVALLAGYRSACSQGAPTVPAEEWFEARLLAESQRAWDAECARTEAAREHAP